MPGPRAFKLIVAVFLLPLGVWLCGQAVHPPRRERPPLRGEPPSRTITALAVVVGVVGGIYGIGGGSILGPILVARGVPVSRVAPATLASTFVTSAAGAVTYGLLALVAPGDIAPNWTVGLSCGLGGLLGGYAGARLQPRLPERSLRLLLGALATVLAAVYLVQAVD